MSLRKILLLVFLFPLTSFARERAVTPPSSNQLVLADYAYGIATGPDGRIWILTSKGLGRVEDGGSIAYVNQLAWPNSSPSSLSLAPDGAFRKTSTTTSMSSITRITTTGDVTSVDIRPGATLAVAFTSDGRTWFTEGSKDRVGFVNAGGVVQEIALDPTFDNPGAIAVAPDQTVWFASRRKIGHVTVSGEIEGFSTAAYFTHRSELASFTSLVVDRDGSFLATVGAERSIGVGDAPGGEVVRFSQRGDFSLVVQYAAPHALSGLRLGPDGSLWFADNYHVNFIAPYLAVVHRETDGTLTTFEVPRYPRFTGDSLNGYAIDTTGTLWILANGPGVNSTLFRFPGAAKR